MVSQYSQAPTVRGSWQLGTLQHTRGGGSNPQPLELMSPELGRPQRPLSLCVRFEVAVSRTEDQDHVLIPVYLREKCKQAGHNHTSTPLFGLPFLITVPRSLSQDKFYNLLLLRMWYGTRTPPCACGTARH